MYAVCQLQPHLGHAYAIELELRTSQCLLPALANSRHPPWAACSTTPEYVWKRFQKNAGDPAQRLAALALRHLIFFLPASVL